MRTRILWLAIAVIVAAAAAYLIYRYNQPSARDLAVARCMEGGDGDMFTSREMCEARYSARDAR
ncbi:MAG: hypothetical protein ACAH11_15850 [Sphingomonas sp.]